MSNREIDRKIAELIGYKSLSTAMHVDIDGTVSYGYLPEFSSDWNAMRLLVEWLGAKGIIVCSNIESTKAFVTLVQNNRLLADVESFPAPLALCEAVLALPTELLGPKGSDATETAQAEEGSD